MIHDWDTYFWTAGLSDGRIISSADYSSADPLFSDAVWVRWEPLFGSGYSAVLHSEIPEGYTAFLRSNIRQPMGGTAWVGYEIRLERGIWPAPVAARMSLDALPLVDGFSAELRTNDGSVFLDDRSTFGFQEENGVFTFIKKVI